MRAIGGLYRSFLIIISISFYNYANGQRLRDNMYETLYGSGACYKRYNGTHEIGCTSKFGGSAGILQLYNEDLDWILENSTTGPYAVILPIEQFTKDVVGKLIHRSDKISGILVINNGTSDRPASFTHQQRCPNSGSQAPWDKCVESGADSKVWNPWGTGMTFLNYPFPIFYIPPEKKKDIEDIHACFYKFNSFDLETQSERSLCAVEMDAFMYGAVNSAVCIRRSNNNKLLSPTRYCDPLGDRSIYTTLFSRNTFQDPSSDYLERKQENNASITLVTAAMDGTSFFESEGINAVGTVSSIVTLMATNQLLHRMFPASDKTDYGKNVLFVLLNGESFDYIGSQRMAWDIASKNFLDPPLEIGTLGTHVHLGQFIRKTSYSSLNAFTPQYNEPDKNDAVDNFLTWMNSSSLSVAANRASGIPPSSVHSFLRAFNTSEINMSSFVLADHGSNFDSKYYQSIFDTGENMGYKYYNISFDASNLLPEEYPVFPDDKLPVDSLQSRLANVSTGLGHALYRHITGKPYEGNLTASAFIIDELLHCFLDTLACRLLNYSLSSPSFETADFPPPSMYVGVNVWNTQHTRTLAQITGLLTGRPVNKTKEECKSPDENTWYPWMNGWNYKGVCLMTHTNYITAVSPAFEIIDYDFSSGQYSTWTESVWSGISLRLLVKPPHRNEVVVLSVGICVALVSVLLVALCTKHVSSLQPESTMAERVREGDESVNC